MQLKKIGWKSRSGNLAEGDNLKIKYKTMCLNLLFSAHTVCYVLAYFWNTIYYFER